MQTLLMDCLGMVLGRCPCLYTDVQLKKNGRHPLENLINDAMKQCVGHDDGDCRDKAQKGTPGLSGCALNDHSKIRGCLYVCLQDYITNYVATLDSTCKFCRGKAKNVVKYCLMESLLTTEVGCPKRDINGWFQCGRIYDGYQFIE